MHAADDAQVRVQRPAPPGTRGRQTRGEAQSPSAAQGSSSCPWVVPPVLDVLLVVVEEVVPLVLVVPLALVDAPAPELEVLVAPPVPEALVLLPAPPEPVGPGTHWALTLHVSPGGQSREASTQSCLHIPAEQ